MKNVDWSRYRRSSGLLLAAAALAAACGRKKEPERPTKLADPVPAAAPLTDVVARQASAPTNEQQSEGLPAWTQQFPHFFTRSGRRYASAVGWAVSGDPALGRAAAEDRARVDLLGLINGGLPGSVLQGSLPGARMVDSFSSPKDKKVYVLVEVEAPAQP